MNRSQIAPVSSRVAGSDGVSLNVVDWGGDKRVVCILIHGSAEGAFVWEDLAPKLAWYCRVVAVDLRGHGESDHAADGRYDFESHIRDVKLVVQGLRAERLVLVGHSLGGDLAAFIAPSLGKTLVGLVVVDTGPGIDESVIRVLQERLLESHRKYRSIEDYYFWLSANRTMASVKVLRAIAKQSLKRCSDGLYQPKFDVAVIDGIARCRRDDWWIPVLQQLKMPILIVRGIGSAILTKKSAEIMKRSAVSATLSVISGAGHAVMSDNPSEFSDVTVRFINDVITASR